MDPLKNRLKMEQAKISLESIHQKVLELQRYVGSLIEEEQKNHDGICNIIHGNEENGTTK